MSGLRFTLYHRRGCHLCDEMLEALEMLCHGRNVDIRMVDVDTDPALAGRYGTEVPVLSCDGDEICRHRLDADAVRARF